MDVIQDYSLHLWESYEWALTGADERVADWLLMKAYWPTLTLTAVYLLLVWLGPKYMQGRSPVQLRWTLFFYNMGLVLLNFHICFELFTATWALNYSYSCQEMSHSLDHHEMRVAKALWWYYVSKLVEFLDTIFFVMRKKNNQISFLHVYHHATMFPIWWIGVKWVPGGQSFFGAMINSFIHVIMYSYYAVAALGPQYQKYLWWKKYLTRLQLGQFLMLMVYGVQSLYRDCNFPRWMQWSALLYGVSIITLFLNYYYKTYVSHCRPHHKVQFLVGMAHAAQSIYGDCRFPMWMQWALIVYGMSILALFLNFYFQSYVKPKHKQQVSKKNGDACVNGSVTANGAVESKKDN